MTSFTGNTGDSTGNPDEQHHQHAAEFGVRSWTTTWPTRSSPIAGGSLNQLSGNVDGVNNQTATHLDFRQNWWGNASGPSDWSIGTGDSVSSDVQFFPWITVLADDFNPDQFAVCSISGNNSPNVLNGTAGNDIICGKGGNDSINGHGRQRPRDRRRWRRHLSGAPGDDAVLGTSGDDIRVAPTSTRCRAARHRHLPGPEPIPVRHLRDRAPVTMVGERVSRRGG